MRDRGDRPDDDTGTDDASPDDTSPDDTSPDGTSPGDPGHAGSSEGQCRYCGAPLAKLVHGACAYCGTPVARDQDVPAGGFSVVLVMAGIRRLKVIDRLHTQTGWPLPDAIRLVDAAASSPQALTVDQPPGASRRLASALREAGATVEVHAPPPPPSPPLIPSGMFAVVLTDAGRKHGRLGAALMTSGHLSSDESAWLVTELSEGGGPQIAGYFADRDEAQTLLDRLLELDARAELRDV